jgi:hypothetical protein
MHGNPFIRRPSPLRALGRWGGHLRAFEIRLRAAAVPYLWLVDDLPVGPSEDDHRAWFAPNGYGKTLITTRSREHNSTGGVVDLGVLEPSESYELLTVHRKPAGEQEEAAARALVSELGHHALAVDVAGGALAALPSRENFAGFLDKVREPSKDALATAAELGSDLHYGSGSFHAAWACFETVLATRRRLLGDEHLDTLSTRGQRTVSGQLRLTLSALSRSQFPIPRR